MRKETGFYWVSLGESGEDPEPVVACWEPANEVFRFDGRWYAATDALFREAAKAGYRMTVKFTRPKISF
jgi:hypothetical protein